MNSTFFIPQTSYRCQSSHTLFLKICMRVLILQLLSSIAKGQVPGKPETIRLQAEAMPFTPKHYHIANIIDERKDRKAIAYLIPSSSTGNSQLSAATRPIDLEGGGLTAIRQYMKQSLGRNTSLRPVTIRLKEYLVTESAADKGRVAGKVDVSMSFEWQREGETVHLIDYKGGAQYNRSVNQIAAVERVLRQSLVSAMRYFDTWINQQADGNEKLAKALKVTFTDFTRNTQKDTVFYSPDRPLIWDDFRDKPRVGRFAASVFPSFSYEGQSKVENGIIHVNLTLKVYVLKNSSWVRNDAREPYGLNHEQRHFDIVKLVAERFKQKIQPDSLTLEDYNSIIQYQYLESYREMNRLQEQYDGETGHGLNKAAQELWNRRIDSELRSFMAKE